MMLKATVKFVSNIKEASFDKVLDEFSKKCERYNKVHFDVNISINFNKIINLIIE